MSNAPNRSRRQRTAQRELLKIERAAAKEARDTRDIERLATATPHEEFRAKREHVLHCLSDAVLRHLSEVACPFNVLPSAPPSLYPVPGQPERVTQSYDLRAATPSADGTVLSGLVVGHPYAFAAFTDSPPVVPSPTDGHEYYDALDAANAVWPSTVNSTITVTGGGNIVLQCMDVARKLATIRARFSRLIPIGCAARIRYTGPIIDTAGMIVIAPLPSGSTPAVRVSSAAGVPIPGANTMQASPLQLDYSTIEAMEGARLFTLSSLLNGPVEMFCPFGGDPPLPLATADTPSGAAALADSRTLGEFQLPPRISNSCITGGDIGVGTLQGYYVQSQSQFSFGDVIRPLVFACKGMPADGTLSVEICATFWAQSRFRGDNASTPGATAARVSMEQRALAARIAAELPVATHGSFMSKFASALGHIPGVFNSVGRLASIAQNQVPKFLDFVNAFAGSVGELDSLGAAVSAGDASAAVDAALGALIVL